jgi:uncharacterized protein involved in exopolysaccharide biosynthesis
MSQKMQDYLNSNSDDEIDVRELFFILWAHKILITFTIVVGFIYAGYYALNADKKFTSTATFNLDENESIGTTLAGMGQVSAFQSLSNGFSKYVISESQINGRIFIKKIDAKLNLQLDPFFNTYKPKTTDPIWKSIIKRAVGWQKSPKNIDEAMWQRISSAFSKNIKINITDDGAIEVSFTHENPVRAAKIANTIMEEVISTKKQKSENEQDGQLSYLSKTLTKALSDLENSQSKLKAFALENSALPLENFVGGSLKLDALREQLSQTTKLHEAVAELSEMMKNKTMGPSDYISLRNKYPIVDLAEFRRILGQNEIVSTWIWPENSTINAVFDTLADRKRRLISRINTSQIEAQRSSQALKKYGRLERDATIAEATYTVLIEQVKTQSMMVGYQPSIFEIYEYASPSIYPTGTNRNVILVLGASIGLLVGITLALVLGIYRGVFYSRRSLVAATRARFNSSISTLSPLRNKSLVEINTHIKKKPHSVLRDISVEIHKSGTVQTIVTSSRAKMTANKTALALALSMQSDKTKIAVINFSEKHEKQSFNADQASVGSFLIAESEGQVSLLEPLENTKAMDLVSHKEFLNKIRSLETTFNMIFLCADNGDAISLLRALEGQKVFHLALARVKRTKSDAILSMRSLLPIQGLLHD